MKSSLPLPSASAVSLSLIVLFLMIGTEFAYRSVFYAASESFIQGLQHNTPILIQDFLALITGIGNGPILIYLLLLFCCFASREFTFYYCAFVSVYIWLKNLTKLSYHEGRPYISFVENVRAEACEAGYGNPSGHSWGGAAFPMMFFLWWFCPIRTRREDYSDEIIQNEAERDTKGKCTVRKVCLIVNLLLCILFAFMLAFSRLQVGVHSLNQVFYGLQWGYLQAVAMHYVVSPYLVNHFRDLYTPSVIGFQGCSSVAEARHGTAKLVLGGIGSALFMFATFLIPFLVLKFTLPVPREWVWTVLDNCPSLVENKRFANESFIDMGLALLFPCAYLGVLVDTRNGDSEASLKAMRPVDRLSLKSCLRIVVTVTTLGVIMVPYILVDDIENLILATLARKAIPAILLGLYIFGLLRRMLQWLHLEYQEEKKKDTEDAPQPEGHQYLQKLI